MTLAPCFRLVATLPSSRRTTALHGTAHVEPMLWLSPPPPPFRLILLLNRFCIDMQQFNGETCLVFMDNGYGMRPDVLHKMLGFGHSDKKEVDGHR